MSEHSGAWPFPHADDKDSVLRCVIRLDGGKAQPAYIDFGGFPPDEDTLLDDVRKLKKGQYKKFFAKIHSHVGGIWYKLKEHYGKPRTFVFSGPLLHAYWLRENDDDPDLDVGTVVVGGIDRRGRHCFQRVPEIFVVADAINAVDQRLPETVFASQSNCSNDGTANEEERLLIHFPHAVTVLWDSSNAMPNLGIRAYHDVDFVIAWGNGPLYSTDLEIGYGTEMRLILGDFTPASVTWKWCYTDGNLSLGTDVATFSDIYRFDPPSGWDLDGTTETTEHYPDKNPIGDTGTEVGGFGNWNPTDETCYGVELRHVAPTVDDYSGGSNAPTIASYGHTIAGGYTTTIAWRKLWWI